MDRMDGMDNNDRMNIPHDENALLLATFRNFMMFCRQKQDSWPHISLTRWN